MAVTLLFDSATKTGARIDRFDVIAARGARSCPLAAYRFLLKSLRVILANRRENRPAAAVGFVLGKSFGGKASFPEGYSHISARQTRRIYNENVEAPDGRLLNVYDPHTHSECELMKWIAPTRSFHCRV